MKRAMYLVVSIAIVYVGSWFLADTSTLVMDEIKEFAIDQFGRDSVYIAIVQHNQYDTSLELSELGYRVVSSEEQLKELSRNENNRFTKTGEDACYLVIFDIVNNNPCYTNFDIYFENRARSPHITKKTLVWAVFGWIEVDRIEIAS